MGLIRATSPRCVLMSAMAIGATGVVAQVVVMRELVTSFHGNELTVGVVMAIWLLLEAVGAFSARRAARTRSPYLRYLGVLLLSLLLLPLSLWMSRVIRVMLDVPHGHAFGLMEILVAAVLVSLPVSVLHGALFTLACESYSFASDDQSGATGKVYVWETAGTLTGAGLLTLFLADFQSFQIITATVTTGVMCWLFFSLRLIVGQRTRTVILAIGVVLLAAAGVTWAGSYPAYLHDLSAALKWQGYEVVAYQDSRHGNIAVIRTKNQLSLCYDGTVSATVPAPDISTIEHTAHLPLLFHPDPTRVLIISGGVGGVLSEVQKHDVQLIRYVEIDPSLISVARSIGAALIDEELSDPRLELSYLDGRLYVRTSQQQYDVMILGMSEPGTLQVNRLFTQEFFQLARQRLAPGGILCLSLPGSDVYLSPEALDLNRCIYKTLTRVFPHVRVLPGDRNWFFASMSDRVVEVAPSDLTKRLHDRGLRTALLSGPYLSYLLDETRWSHLSAAISKDTGIRINTDLSPAGLSYTLSYWGAMYTPQVQEALRRVQTFDARWVVLLSLVGPPLVVAAFPRASLAAPVSYTVLSTGLAGMALDLALIFTFQCFYGYVYHMLGMLVASFMAGAVVGGLLAGRLTQTNDPVDLLLGIETGLIGFCLLLLVLFRLRPSGSLTEASPLLFWVGCTLAGSLVGATFATASSAMSSRMGAGATGGLLYSLDLTGGFVGGFLCSIVLVPLLGIEKTLAFVAAIKGGSVLALAVGASKDRRAS